MPALISFGADASRKPLRLLSGSNISSDPSRFAARWSASVSNGCGDDLPRQAGHRHREAHRDPRPFPQSRGAKPPFLTFCQRLSEAGRKVDFVSLRAGGEVDRLFAQR
jgi:hypothetical protein